MKCVIFDAPGAVRVGEYPTPALRAGEVLVRIGAAGVCTGDLYIYLGKNPYAAYPVVGGHEIAGVVERTDHSVAHLRPGDRVVVEPFIGCGACYPCRVGKPNCCANLRIIGVHCAGGFAEFVSAPADRLHAVPAGLSLATACLAEPLAIGVQACRRGQVHAGELVLILGCGPIGLAIIEVALAHGAHPVAVDLDAGRLGLALSLGAETLPADARTVERVLKLTNGEGAPVVIEATGNVKAMEQTFDLVAAGGRIVIVGLVKRGTGVTFPGLDFTRKEITIVGSRASANCFPAALELLAQGRIKLPSFATELPMWEAPETFRRLGEDSAALQKAILIPAGAPR